LKDYGYKASD